MLNLNKISIINEYQNLKEKKENLEIELYKFCRSITGKSATYDELVKEVQYRKDISTCEYKMKCLETEFKAITAIKAGLLILGLSGAIILASISIKCNKDNNKITPSSDISSVSTEDELEDKKVLTKTLN